MDRKVSFQRVAAYAVILFILTCITAYAEDGGKPSELSESETANMLVIDEVKVKGKVSEHSVEGKTVIDREVIRLLPRGNGDITEALRVVPSVQFDDDYKDSFTGGEIDPGRISISGGKDYQNLFLIDGMNNSSIMNPAKMSNYNVNDVPGHPQKFIVDSSIVKSVTVFDSNVPAKYSGFLGGVVDVKTIDPTQKVWGNISFRTTRSNWAHLYVHKRREYLFENSNTSMRQPKYEKHHFNTTFNTPVTDRIAVLFNYKRLESTIPVRFFDSWNNESRLSETFLAKGLMDIDGSSYMTATLSYSPYEKKLFLPDVKDGGFYLRGGGYFGSFNYVKEKDDSKLEIHADHSYSTNNKDAPSKLYRWAATSSKDWGFGHGDEGIDTDGDKKANVNSSVEGGYGDLEKSETESNFSLDHTPFNFRLGGDHRISYGIQYKKLKGTMRKPDDTYEYNGPTIDPDVYCGEQEGIDCLEGEQYFTSLDIGPSFNNVAKLNFFGVYLEDEYEFWRFTLRTGLRYDYNDYMSNHDIAPRTHFEYDIFDTKRTVLLAGYNRYYDKPILAYKLRAMEPHDLQYIRSTYHNEVTEWIPKSARVSTKYNYSELKTPYGDEYMVGVAQYFLGGTLNLKYVTRDNKDEYARGLYVKKGIRYYILNNNGSSTFESVQLKWERMWENHSLLINAMWQKSKTSNENYDDRIELKDMDKYVVYNGREIKGSELPKDNYNRPIVVNLTYTGRFFKKLEVSPMIKYRASYRSLEKLSSNSVLHSTGEVNPETGAQKYESVDTFKDVTFDASILVDLRFAWSEILYKKHKLKIFFDINNIFDSKVVKGFGSTTVEGEEYEEYEMGRSFWAGVEYAF